MERDKSRGLKHMQDKKKYKGNSIKNPKYVPTKTQPNLGSNWERYEGSDESEEVLTTSTDFKLLSNAPITTGSHFQFRQDQLYEDKEGQNEDNLFSLNLRALHRSVLTIPFYTRVGISEEYFTEEQLIKMQKNAKTALNSHEYFLKHDKDLAVGISQQIQKTLLNKSSDDDLGSQDISKNHNIQKGDTLLELIENNCELTSDLKNNSCVGKVMSKNPEDQDLEDWLEDILDKD